MTVHHSSALRTISRLMHPLQCVYYLCVQDCLSDYVMLYSPSAAQAVNRSRHLSWSGNSTDVLLVLLGQLPFPVRGLGKSAATPSTHQSESPNLPRCWCRG